MLFKFESQVFDELSRVDRFYESSIRRAFARSVEAVPLSIRIFIGLSGAAWRFRVRSQVKPGMMATTQNSSRFPSFHNFHQLMEVLFIHPVDKEPDS